MRVRFTENLRRHVSCADAEVPASPTVRACLEAYFVSYPDVRGYVLDDQGAVRNHVVIFVDGTPIHDRTTQSDAIASSGEILVMQALSGG